MKRPIKTVFALALLVLGNVPAFADTLASFNLTDFLGWTYTRPDFQLSTEAIGANKVRLFKASNATDYTLLSPAIKVDGIAAITVKATLLAPTYSSKSYDLTKGSPIFELLDPVGNVVASEFLQYTSALVQRDVQIKIDIPSGVNCALPLGMPTSIALWLCVPSVLTAVIAGWQPWSATKPASFQRPKPSP